MSVVFSCCFQEPRSSKRRMKERERAKKHCSADYISLLFLFNHRHLKRGKKLMSYFFLIYKVKYSSWISIEMQF